MLFRSPSLYPPGKPSWAVSAQFAPLLDLTSFWPTLTAWKFIPNTAGVPLPGEPSCLRPLISLMTAATLRADHGPGERALNQVVT